MTVKWKDIIAECGNYKAGFVAVFRQYEGEPTDERDGQGRPMKVSANTFADHMGIARGTFKGWLKNASGRTSTTPQERTATSHANVAKNLARSKPDDLVDAIASAGPAAMDAVARKLNLRRAGAPNLTKADRKAIDASVNEVGSAILRTAAAGLCAMHVDVLNELHDELEDAIAEGTVTPKMLDAIAKAAQRIVTTATAGKAFVA